ncbi:MAG: sugar phosphate isomerase/epimerase [Planctomycetaceae bacterium]|nr:sugar phosphate isomerase/epimerase [Planctomycetaceae bacterium]
MTNNPLLYCSRRQFLKNATGVALTASASPFVWGDEKKLSTPRYRYTCSSVNYASLSLEEACRRISDLGYEALDIWDSIPTWLQCSHLKHAAEVLKADGLIKLLEKYRLKLCGFSVYAAGYAKYAELLGQCGGGISIQGSRVPSADSLLADMKKFMEELKPALELCEKYHFDLLIENHSGKALLNKLDSLKAFVDANTSNRIGIALAPYHVLINKESVAEAIRICGKQLRFIYVWSNEPNEKQMPGVGTVDMKDWIAALNEIGYSHAFAPFMHHEPAPDRMDELHRQSLQYLRGLEK